MIFLWVLKSRKPFVKKSAIYVLELSLDEEGIPLPRPRKLCTPLLCQRIITYEGLLQEELMSLRAGILERSKYFP